MDQNLITNEINIDVFLSLFVSVAPPSYRMDEIEIYFFFGFRKSTNLLHSMLNEILC